MVTAIRPSVDTRHFPKQGERFVGGEWVQTISAHQVSVVEATGLTEERVRAIVREEMALLLAWRHDAAHGGSRARVRQQWGLDKTAGVAVAQSRAERPAPAGGVSEGD